MAKGRTVDFSLYSRVGFEDFKKFKNQAKKVSPEYRKAISYISTFNRMMAGIFIEFEFPIDTEKGISLLWKPMHNEVRAYNRWRLMYKNGTQEISAAKCTFAEKLSFQPHLEEFLLLVLKTLQNHKPEGE